MIDAIIKSGGITTRANLKEVILKRRLPGNDMNYKLAKLDLFSLIREGNQSQNPLLFDGDVILLKEVKEKDKGSFDKTLGNLYPEEIDVYIIGEVTNPGLNTILANSTLSQAILSAGGTKFSRANTSNIELIRLNNNGSASLRKFSYNPGLGASEENNPILLNGDVEE